MKFERERGFTLIEMMIVIAIIGILIAIALPSYRAYTLRAHYTEIVQATAPFKVGVEECYQVMDSLENCGAGMNGVPDAITADQSHGLVNSIDTSNNGVITVTPNNQAGITNEDLYILTPTIENNVLIWTTSGNGVTKGYAQ